MGVLTCALPIWARPASASACSTGSWPTISRDNAVMPAKLAFLCYEKAQPPLGRRLEATHLQVDFYHLTASPMERVVPVLAERVVSRGGRLLIVAGEDRLVPLDRLLWKIGRAHV